MTEVSPADAERVLASPHANLVACDANRVLVGIFNRHPSDVPLHDKRARQALNLAVDRQKVVAEGLLGYATPLSALTPPWCSGFPAEAEPYPHDPERAKELLEQAGWPEGRPLRIATPAPFEGIARLVAADLEAALEIGVEVSVVPGDKLLAGARALVEKKLAPTWDVLLHGWFDLSSEAPPAVVHREFFGSDGAFRAGPELAEFNALYAEMAAQTDGAKMVAVAERIDRHVHEEALALFLCAPQVLYAVNKHVRFGPYRTTFELAETEVDEQHWSRRGGKGASGGGRGPQGSGRQGVGQPWDLRRLMIPVSVSSRAASRIGPASAGTCPPRRRWRWSKGFRWMPSARSYCNSSRPRTTGTDESRSYRRPGVRGESRSSARRRAPDYQTAGSCLLRC